MDSTQEEHHIIVPEEVEKYLAEYKQLNQHILVNKFKLPENESKKILDYLKSKDIVIESYYLLCSHCQSVADSGILLEENEKIKLKNSYKCWSCKKKFNSKDSKLIKHYRLKQALFDELRDQVFK